MSRPFELDTAEYRLVISPSAREVEQPKPASSLIRVQFGAVSDQGKVRSKNEDHFMVSRIIRKQDIVFTNVPTDQFPDAIREDGYSMVVADGMGGMAAGDVASRLAISTGMKLFHKSPKWGFKINHKEAKELFERVNSRLQEIDRTLSEHSYADRRLFGMGTTLTAAYSIGIDLFIIHLGDSRAYLFRGGKIKQLTKDHTVAQAMADAGYITSEAVRHHRKRNALTNFLGGHDGKINADIRWLRLADQDRLLLCSDGLHDMVEDEVIARIMAEHDQPGDSAQALVDEALKQGGKDNVTVIVARYEIPPMSPAGSRESSERMSGPMASDTFEGPLHMQAHDAMGSRR